MTDHYLRGAEWMLGQVVAELRAQGQCLHAEAIRRYGRELLDLSGSATSDDESVFPAAADLPVGDDFPTIKAV